MSSNDSDVDEKGDDKAEWSARNEKIFIHILHEHVKEGDLKASTFSKKIWTLIDDELHAETNKRFTISKLKSKFNRLRKKHREFSDLIQQSGFSWDPVTNTVTASEVVWADYAKKVPGVKPYRRQGLKHYDVLGEIFDAANVAGQLNMSPIQLPPNKEDECGLEVVIPKDIKVPPVECNKGKRIRQPVIQYLERPKKRWNKMENLLEICSDVMSQKLEKAKEKSHESINKATEMYSIEECIETVEAMGDVDNQTFIKLMDKIVVLEWRIIFLAMNDGRRRAWLSSL
ncbi:hypothetical protein ACOSP7_004370 [Xanthoceras sorbifolium]|uniref:Myb/SANT-like domain-containing protein n=1 Tax=Xanthoceras sorbifolium TaxID=99658 RepID=A0ABQ8IH26_9ROSI|nr:hypothetical protein JRO89_XS02G0203300 [Xanthoceras sorbifolium]